jgi:hypothetical protein
MAKRQSSNASLSSSASQSNLKSASPSTMTTSPPASRLGGFTVGGLVAGNGGGTGSRGSTPASPFSTTFRTDSRTSLKKDFVADGLTASPSLRNRELGGAAGKLSNGLARTGSRATSPPTMTFSPPATTSTSPAFSRSPPPSSPPHQTVISPAHSSPAPVSPPSTATSAASSLSNQQQKPPSEILNLQHHFQLVEEGWKLSSSRTSPVGDADAADVSSQSLDLLDAQIDPLRITKKSPTFPPSPFLPPPDSFASHESSLSPLPSPAPHLTSSDGDKQEEGSTSPPQQQRHQEEKASSPKGLDKEGVMTPDGMAQTLVIQDVSTPDSTKMNTAFSTYSQGSWGGESISVLRFRLFPMRAFLALLLSFYACIIPSSSFIHCFESLFLLSIVTTSY